MSKKIAKKIGIVCLLLIVLVCVSFFALKAVTFFQNRIPSKDGVQENCWVTLGGCEQCVRVRGENKNNPVVIFLHGGPGSPTGFLSYAYQPLLEDAYTFLYWEQRASGRTYFKNEKDFSAETISVDRLLSDLDELVSYAKKRFNKDRVIIMAHSWGTVLGLRYVSEHPENVSAYVGIGQVIQGASGDVLAAGTACERALSLASEAEATGNGKQAAVHRENADTLKQSIAAYKNTKTMKEFDCDNFMQMRTLAAPYLIGKREKSMSTLTFAGVRSPDMSFTDIRWFFKTSDMNVLVDIEKNLLQYAFFDFDAYTSVSDEFSVPMYFISGACDWVTPAVLVKEYAQTVRAPHCVYEEIPETGHSVYFDAPEEFAALCNQLLSSR